MSQKNMNNLENKLVDAGVLSCQNKSRRNFLGKAAGASVIIAPGVTLIGISSAQSNTDVDGADSSKRWGMLIDTNSAQKDAMIVYQHVNKRMVGAKDLLMRVTLIQSSRRSGFVQ